MKKLIILFLLLLASPVLADDRTDLQAEIDALAPTGGVVYLEPRTYTLTQAPGQPYSLTLPGGVDLVGAGREQTLLVQADGAGASQRLIYVAGQTRVADLSLFGNKAYQTVDEHRAGLFILNSNGSVVERVDSYGFTGDGFTVYNNVYNLAFSEVAAYDNARDGLAITPAGTGAVVSGVSVIGSRFYSNAGQQLDSEPGVTALVSLVLVKDCYLDVGPSTQYALTIAGSGTATPTLSWLVKDNTINGTIETVWAERVDIVDNRGQNPTVSSSVFIYRTSKGVSVRGNDFFQIAGGTSNGTVVLVSGTSGQQPSNIQISDNRIRSAYFPGFGVRLSGVVDAEVSGNTISGVSTGIYARSTLPVKHVLITRNRVFGSTLGVSLGGLGGVVFQSATVAENFIETGTGVSADDGYHSLVDVVLLANTCLGTPCLTNVPTSARVF